MVSLSILFQKKFYRISCSHLMLFICIVCFIFILGLEMHLHRLPKIWSEIYYLMKNIEWMEGVSIKSDQYHVTWTCILLFMAHQCFNVVKLKFCAQWHWTAYTLLRYFLCGSFIHWFIKKISSLSNVSRMCEPGVTNYLLVLVKLNPNFVISLVIKCLSFGVCTVIEMGFVSHKIPLICTLSTCIYMHIPNYKK